MSGRFFFYYRGLGNDYNGSPGFVKQKPQMARKRSQASRFKRDFVIGQGVLPLKHPESQGIKGYYKECPARVHTIMSIATRPFCRHYCQRLSAYKASDDCRLTLQTDYQSTGRLMIDRQTDTRIYGTCNCLQGKEMPVTRRPLPRDQFNGASLQKVIERCLLVSSPASCAID